MKYKCEVTINLPRETVVDLFRNYDLREHWQPGLVRIERVKGTLGEVNGVCNMYCNMGKKEMIIRETILEQHLPDYVSAIYVANGMENVSTDEFIANPNHTTTYVSEQTFYSNKFFYRMLLIFSGKMFRKATWEALDAFKDFCEGYDLDQ